MGIQMKDGIICPTWNEVCKKLSFSHREKLPKVN